MQKKLLVLAVLFLGGYAWWNHYETTQQRLLAEMKVDMREPVQTQSFALAQEENMRRQRQAIAEINAEAFEDMAAAYAELPRQTEPLLRQTRQKRTMAKTPQKTVKTDVVAVKSETQKEGVETTQTVPKEDSVAVKTVAVPPPPVIVPAVTTTIPVYFFNGSMTVMQHNVPAGTADFLLENKSRLTHDFLVNGVSYARLRPGAIQTVSVPLGAGAHTVESQRHLGTVVALNAQ